jgi:hypothetical protein
VSAALASPLPVQAVQEARELVVELSVRAAPVDNQVLQREVTTDTQSGVNLRILAREHESFEDYVPEVRVLSIFPSPVRLLPDGRHHR